MICFHIQGENSVEWTGFDGGSNVNSFCGKNVSLQNSDVIKGKIKKGKKKIKLNFLVISSDLPLKEENALFITVPFKPLSYQNCGRNHCFALRLKSGF